MIDPLMVSWKQIGEWFVILGKDIEQDALATNCGRNYLTTSS